MPGRRGHLLLAQTGGLDLGVQHEAQQNCVGLLWILPGMEHHMDLLGPAEEVRDCDGVLPAVMDTQDSWDAVVALKRPTGLELGCGRHGGLLAVKR